MNTTELMIGDWVKIKGYDGLRITSINKRFASFDRRWHGERLDKIEPIPITLDFLEKNGLGKLYTDYYDLDVYEANDGLWRVVYSNLECSGFDESVLVSSVHELQHFLRHVGIDKDIEI